VITLIDLPLQLVVIGSSRLNWSLMGMLIGSKHDSQVCGIDYHDTFSRTIVKIIYIWALMALAIENDFDVHQVDIKTTFINDYIYIRWNLYATRVYPTRDSSQSL